MAFLEKKKNLIDVRLNGKELPWVKSAKDLGCKITTEKGGHSKSGLMEKRATYINKVNKLIQKFHYAHPSKRVGIKNIFNSHFHGSCL